MKRIISVLASTALLLGIFAAAPAAVSATSFAPASEVDHWVSKGGRLVSDGSGGYSCSRPGYRLIEDAAAQAEPGEVIHICRGTYFESDIEVDASVGLGITIQGDGPNRTFIDARSDGRIFTTRGFTEEELTEDAGDISDWETPSIRVADMTLRGGDAQDGEDGANSFPGVDLVSAGGAVSSLGIVECNNVRFTGNYAGIGGAIYAGFGVRSERCTFANNKAMMGGAIASFGTVDDLGSTFSSNRAVGFGGAVWALPFFSTAGVEMHSMDDSTGLMTNSFTNSIFSKNAAGMGGGAVAIEESCTEFDRSTFTKNSTAGAGGAVYMNEGSFSATAQLLLFGYGVPGDFLSLLESGFGEGFCDSQIINTKFESNSATLSYDAVNDLIGGWCEEEVGGCFTIYDVVGLQSAGGAVAYFGGLDDTTGSAIDAAYDAGHNIEIGSGSIFRSNSAANGGAIYADDAIIYTAGVDFYGNRARQVGPGGYGGYGSAVYVMDKSFMGFSYEGSWEADTRHRATFELNTDPVHEEGDESWEFDLIALD